ncbi:MAG: cytochrome c biogenesis protein CcsA [Chlamydiae bacterium]|nr:cytochrome c biogenesis protein CcsA [Chlamydiota bacterium]MBI3265839.1 cytochrome c biogenesis protein CcsA [Chlamydiota bacterium]
MKRILSFTGSYIFAIVLMIALGMILAVGTFYESTLGTEAAQQLVYKTNWFVVTLGLLFLNVLFSTFKRWPFRKYHTGFVITHAGLLLLLAGSMVSKFFGVEGDLALREKESATAFESHVEEINIRTQKGTHSLKKRFTKGLNQTPWITKIPDSDLELRVDQYYENSVQENVYKAGGRRKYPVLSFSLANAMTSVEDQLVLEDDAKNHLELGPATVCFQKIKRTKDVEKLFLELKEKNLSPAATLKTLIPEKNLDHANILTVFLGPRNKLYYKLQNSSGLSRVGSLSLKEPLQTGWMGLEFKIEDFIPKARVSSRISPSEINKEDQTPALRFKLRNSLGHQTREIWIQRGGRKVLHLDGEHIEIGYQHQMIPLGFKLELVDFNLAFYPGSNQPMNYESKVKITGPAIIHDQDRSIYMNHPLKHRGFKIFQSSYVQGENNGSDVSIFSINHDPGIHFIYGGSIVMILGIYILFFTSRFKNKKNNMVEKIAVSLCMMALFSLSQASSAEDKLNYSYCEKIAIQSGGRTKPLQTFANEFMKWMTGKEKFEGKRAIENLLSLSIDPEQAIERQVIRVTFHPLMEDAKLDLKRKYFSFKELSQNENLQRLFGKMIQKQMQREALNPYERKVAALYQQMQQFHDVVSGDAYTLLPDIQHKDGEWLSLKKMDQYDPKFAQEFKRIFQKVGLSFQKRDAFSFEESTKELARFLRNLPGGDYPSEGSLNREILYNEWAPFQKAWVFYFSAFVFSLFVSPKGRSIIYLLPFVAGFVFHTLGIALRIVISGRAPVSNMYESLIFLIWGICFFALILQMAYKTKLLSSVATFLGFFLLVIAQSVPIDSSITQLVPVLKSNLWLTVHVLTVVLSYSAFALAMGIAHYNLGLYFLGPEKKEAFHQTAGFIYKTIQIGVMFLIAGTILGGVWANESWGRFWGWDPKETWALISILGYLAMIHARYAGWIGNFGISILAILGFSLILMTYYGVNFILAAGLHSYGFGSGGVPYVIGYVLFETAIIMLSMMCRRKA